MKSATNWYKRYLGWFWKHKVITAIIVLIIIIAAAASGGSKENTNSTTTAVTAPTTQSTTTTKTTTTQSAAKPAATPTRQVKGTAVTLGAGTFTGGADVANGVYDVTSAAGQSGNFIVTGTDNYDEILGTDNSLSEVPKIRVQISSGDKIQISGLSSVTFTPVTAAFVTTHTAIDLYAGTFTVGQDVGAGRYVVTPGSGQSGNFIVSGTDSYDEILGGDSSLSEVPSLTVTLTVGDVVSLSGMSQVTFTPSK